MRLSGYIQRIRALGDLKVPPQSIDTIGDMIAEGADLGAVLKKRNATLPPLVLLGIWRAARRKASHDAYLDQVAADRREVGEAPIPPSLLKQTLAEHEVGTLVRASAMAPPGRAAEHRRRDAIKEAVALWKACVGIARKTAELNVAVVEDADEALLTDYEAYATTTTLQELPGDRWRAIRRGEAAGALTLELVLPMDQLVAQVQARGAELSAVAVGRDAEALLGELVLPELTRWAYTLKDQEAQFLAIRDASNAYLNLLTAPRPDVAVAAGVWVGGELAVSLVTRDGKLLHHGKVRPGKDASAALEKVLGGRPVEALVLPTTADNTEALDQIIEGFSSLETLRVRPVAMREGVDACEEEGVPPAALKALVLARRAVRPLKYWGRIDPVQLGLAAYQEELDADALRTAMDDMRQLALAGVKPSDLARPSAGGGAASGRPAPRVLNPSIKSVDDLRPGMEVAGVVTNITQFGAFLNIGLSHEGLVHVSELADHFVNDPNEVVRVGEEVTARVLGVDRARRRISLSLRADRAPRVETGDGSKVPLDDIPGRGRRQPRSGFGGNRPYQGVSGQSRTQALADLEALFKKK